MNSTFPRFKDSKRCGKRLSRQKSKRRLQVAITIRKFDVPPQY